MGLQGRKNGRRINSGYDSPVKYTPTPVASEATNRVSAHLAGIDAVLLTAEGIKKTVTQSSHGFVAGEVVRYNGSAWVKALADTAEDAEAAGMIESVTTHTFVLVMCGFTTVSGMTWTPGSLYRLSEITAGALVTTDCPSASINKPMLNALSATTGVVLQLNGWLVDVESQAQDGLVYSEVTGATTIIPQNAYVANSGSQVVFALPSSMDQFKRFKIVGKGAGGWKIAQNASQTIHYLSTDTTTGVTGYLQSNTRYDCVEVICSTANTDFTVVNCMGTQDVN